ncbi:hypothetical protein, partial [Paenibacillus nuruki]|uniref:hypothetical protein n=1 Tax=Paenibacillus nuruki TaxID=1886670 RepID=UPI000A5BDE81
YIYLKEKLNIVEENEDLILINSYINQEFEGITVDLFALHNALSLDVIISLLDEILTSRIENHLVISLNQESDNHLKNEYKAENYKNNFLHYIKLKKPFKRELKNIKHSNNFITDVFFSIPLYYKLLQVRSKLLNGVENRVLSTDRVKKGVDDLQVMFSVEIQKKITYNIPINSKSIPFDKLLRGFSSLIEWEIAETLNNYSYKHTRDFSENMQKQQLESISYLEFQNEKRNSLRSIFENSEREMLIELWTKDYVLKYAQIFKAINEFEEEKKLKIEQQRFYDDIAFRLCDIFTTCLDQENYFSGMIPSISGLFDKEVMNDFLLIPFGNFQRNNYSIAFLVSGLYIKNSFSELKVANIDFLSGPLFKNYRMDFDERNVSVNIDEKILDSHTWVVVHDINVFESDKQLAIKLGKEKVLDYLNMLHFLIAKEKEKVFELKNLEIYLFNHTSKITTTTFNEDEEITIINVR